MVKNQRGFTLHEILIVLVILSALAALALPSYFRTVELARSNEAKVNLEIIDAAERAYYFSHSSQFWPPAGSPAVTNAAAVNAGLSIEISTVNYSIQVSPIRNVTPSYTATATRLGRPAPAKSYTVSRSLSASGARGGDLPDGSGSFT